MCFTFTAKGYSNVVENDGIYHVTHRDSYVAMDFNTDVSQQGTYVFSVEVKLDDDWFDFSKMSIYLEVKTDVNTYTFASDSVKITNEEFNKISAEKLVCYDGNIVSSKVVLSNVVTTEKTNVYVKDFSFSLKSPVNTNSTQIKFPKMLGAVRNDIWQDSREEIKALMPKLKLDRYRRNLPFFYDWNASHFLPYSSVISYELDYARYAGIDYFAYMLDADNFGAEAHLKTGRNDVKISFIIEPEDNLDVLPKFCKSNCFLKIENRPVIFIDADGTKIKQVVTAVQNKIKGTGSENPIFVLINKNSASKNYSEIDFVASSDGDIKTVNCGNNENSLNDVIASADKYSTLIFSWNEFENSLVPNLTFDKAVFSVSKIEKMHSMLNSSDKTQIYRYDPEEAHSVAEEITSNFKESISNPSPTANYIGNVKNGEEPDEETTDEYLTIDGFSNEGNNHYEENNSDKNLINWYVCGIIAMAVLTISATAVMKYFKPALLLKIKEKVTTIKNEKKSRDNGQRRGK